MKIKRFNPKNIKCGIYQIRNCITNKIYVGSTNNVRKRWNEHELLLGKNVHANRHLQSAYNKYCSENFIFEILEEVKDKNRLLEVEQWWITNTNCCNKNIGYNLCEKAGKPQFPPQNGENNFSAKINDSIAKQIKIALVTQSNRTTKEIAKELHITEGIVSSIKYLRSWMNILPEYNKKLELLTRENFVGENHPLAILNANQVADIKRKLINNISIKELAKEYGVKTETIGEIKRCRRWKHTLKELNSTLLSIKKDPSPKTDKATVYKIKKLLVEGKSPKEISQITSVKIQEIYNIKLLNRWVNIGNEFNDKLKKMKGMSNLSENDVKVIKKLLKEGCKQKDIALQFNVNHRTISRIKTNHQYKNIK